MQLGSAILIQHDLFTMFREAQYQFPFVRIVLNLAHSVQDAQEAKNRLISCEGGNLGDSSLLIGRERCEPFRELNKSRIRFASRRFA